MSLSLNDIWRNMNIGFYSYNDKEKIPSTPGTYAWYYPLDIKSPKYEDFIYELRTVFEYNSRPDLSNNYIEFPWRILKYSMPLILKDLPYKKGVSGKTIKELWDNINKKGNEKALIKFRKALQKSSILLPPLYVGKTKNLYKRYHEHCNGKVESEKGCFKKRFVEHMQKNNINVAFENLIFFAIQIDDLPEHSEEMLEEIIKLLSQPIYSIK